MCRSTIELVPLAALLKPAIRPPFLDVVENHAERLNVAGAMLAAPPCTAMPVALPLNVEPVSESPEIAPPAPPVTPELTVSGE